MTQQAPRYFAFISYSHKDRQFVEKLHRHLERYKLPASLSGQFPTMPKHVRPIFRDADNLAGGKLSQNLQNALKSSRFLIVICSENSAHPNAEGKHYVEEEVRYFLSANPEVNIGRIIPVILRAGDTTSPLDCLPPVLRELDLLGIDALQKGMERTLSDVVAALLELDSDMLWQRWEREQARRRRNHRLLAAAFALCAAVGGWKAYDYYVPHTAYYADYVESHNMPQGLFELEEQELPQRLYYYRIVTHKGLVRELACCNGSGSPFRKESLSNAAWLENRPAGMRLEYSTEGDVFKQIHTDVFGRDVVEHAFADARSVELQSAGNTGLRTHEQQSFMEFLIQSDAAEQQPRTTGTITRYELVRDEQGRIVQEMYRNVYQRPVQDAQGAWGRRYERDESGRVVAIHYLGHNGKPLPNRQGMSCLRLTYGTGAMAPWVVRVAFEDAEGRPAPHLHRWYALEFVRAANGNIEEQIFLDADGKPCMTIAGWARLRYRYDERGNIVRADFLTVEGEPCINILGVASAVTRYDARGRLVEETTLGVDGTPLADKGSTVVTRTREYDDKGNITAYAFFDAEGKPCQHENGYSRATMCYDTQGNVTSIAYFGTDGKPCLVKLGYAAMTLRYDEQGNCVETMCYGVDGKPCIMKHGYAGGIMKYDAKGNEIEAICVDTEGKPCLCDNNYARVTRKFDTMGREIEHTHYGLNGKPIWNIDQGYATATIRYDERGNEVERAWFGPNGKPCPLIEGYVRIVKQYDERGNVIRREYYGPDGKLCKGQKGYSGYTSRYDEQGREIEQSYFDTEGKPYVIKPARAAFGFNINLVGRLDSKNKQSPKETKEDMGYSRITCRFNTRSKCIEYAYYGPDGKPALHEDGYSRQVLDYDDYGNIIEEAYYDTEGKPCRNKEGVIRYTRRFDEHGHEIERTDYGTDHLPCLNEDGYATHRSVYDQHGELAEQRLFGTDGKPCLGKYRYARHTVKRDDQGHIIEQCWYDTDDRLCIGPDCYARITMQWDAQGRFTEQCWYGVDDQPCKGPDNAARYTVSYDEKGRQCELAYYETDGTLMKRVRFIYDERGRKTGYSLFDSQGREHRFLNVYR